MEYNVPFFENYLRWGSECDLDNTPTLTNDSIVVSENSDEHEISFSVPLFQREFIGMPIKQIILGFKYYKLSTVILEFDVYDFSIENITNINMAMLREVQKAKMIAYDEDSNQFRNLTEQITYGQTPKASFLFSDEYSLVGLSFEGYDVHLTILCKPVLENGNKVKEKVSNGVHVSNQKEKIWSWLYDKTEDKDSIDFSSPYILKLKKSNDGICFGDNKSKFFNLDILDESSSYYLEELVERYFINEDEIELPSQNLLECGQMLFLNDRFYEIHLSYYIGGETFNSVQDILGFSHEVAQRHNLELSSKYKMFYESILERNPHDIVKSLKQVIWKSEKYILQLIPYAISAGNLELYFRFSVLDIYERIEKIRYADDDEKQSATYKNNIAYLKKYTWPNKRCIRNDKLKQNGNVVGIENTNINNQCSVLDSSVEDLMLELNSLIGLSEVKCDVQSIINTIRVNKVRKERGLPLLETSNHLVFSGNPGTGKTTVARLLAKLYKGLGILSKGQLIETDRAGLVAEYVGQTAVKTRDVINSALGGVLFIDEAYTLSNKNSGQDFGQEAIDTLLKQMEDNRNDLIVIVAGYTNLMKEFINSNPGLKSRFNKYIDFPDYNPDELLKIFISMCDKSKFKLSKDAFDDLTNAFIELYSNRDEHFGNARLVRNIFEKSVINLNNRIALKNNISNEDLTNIYSSDIRGAIDEI